MEMKEISGYVCMYVCMYVVCVYVHVHGVCVSVYLSVCLSVCLLTNFADLSHLQSVKDDASNIVTSARVFF